MRHIMLIGIGLVSGMLLISGCSTSTTMLQENWGRSVETASFNQTVNPRAGEAEPVEGMDGQSALKTLQEYRGKPK